MDEIVFLGTGGGRFCTITQWRATGGFRLNLENFKIQIDPGPGALVRSKEFHQNPQNINCLIVTHAHPDHSTDASVMVEAMTGGGFKDRGIFIGSESVINGNDEIGPVISKYHLNLPKEIHIFKPGDSTLITKEKTEIELSALKTIHSDLTTVGIRFTVKGLKKVISYTSDTEYFENLPKIHKGADILILNVMRPRADRIPAHLCSEDVIKILNEVSPKLSIIQHFGMKMLRANPFNEARMIEKETGVRVIAAKDGMKISMKETEQVTLKEF